MAHGASNGTGAWSGLLAPLRHDANLAIYPFYQDKAFQISDGAHCDGQPEPVRDSSSSLYLDPTQSGPIVGTDDQSYCDGLSALAFDAQGLYVFNGRDPADVIVANSMGGAITRGWMAYAKQKDPAEGGPQLGTLRSVIFVEGAHQGSWAAGLDENLSAPLVTFSAPMLGTAEYTAGSLVGFDPHRPAIADLVPASPWYAKPAGAGLQQGVNGQSLPVHVNYFNINTDLRVQVNTCLAFVCGAGVTDSFGDLVLLPGSRVPSDTPLSGGSAFFPVASGSAIRYQYTIGHLYTENLQALLEPVSSVAGDTEAAEILLADPANHLNIGRNVTSSQTGVANCAVSGPASVTITAFVINIVNEVPGC